MPSDKVHMDFMVVMCEMSVMFYDHHTRKMVSYEGYCKKVKEALDNPDEMKKDYFTYYNYYEDLMRFLLAELRSQYGLVGPAATEIIVDFFTNEYWLGIYNSQTLVNRKMFPKGYNKALKRKKRRR